MNAIAAHSDHDVRTAATELFARYFRAYLECDDEVQAIVHRQAVVATDPDVDEEDRALALATVHEALFPETSPFDHRIGIELGDLERLDTGEEEAVTQELDREEATFASRLAAAMAARGLTQAQLSATVGVSQPAISNLLNRACRPQSRTVARMAEALGIRPEELWPGR